MTLSMTRPDPELELLRAAQSGDPDAAEALARLMWPRIRRQALVVTGDPVLAEDASQEALLKLLRVLPRFDNSRPLGPWLRTLVRNVCYDQSAARARHDSRQGTFVDPGTPSRIESRLDLSSAAREALDAFKKLSPRQREALELVDRQGHTPAEAAVLLDISPGTVRALLYQGRRALRAHLTHRDDIVALLRDEETA